MAKKKVKRKPASGEIAGHVFTRDMKLFKDDPKLKRKVEKKVNKVAEKFIKRGEKMEWDTYSGTRDKDARYTKFLNLLRKKKHRGKSWREK